MNTLTTNIKIARLLKSALVLFLIFVRIYSYGQLVVNNDCSNISSPTTIDLTKHVIDNHPTGTTLTWHTGTPATSSNKYLGDPTKAPASSAGIDYYAAYEDVSTGTPCYSPTSSVIRGVLVNCTGIPLTNTCPTTFVDLTNHVTGTPPAGSTLVWIKGLPLNISNQVSNPSQVAENGDYYAAFYDAVNNCFSPVGAPITVTINTCANVTLANVCPSTSVDLTSHASPLTSTGGAPLKWFTSSTPSTSTMVVDPSNVSTSGTYYPAYYDAVNNCFSPSGSGVVVTISSCQTLNPDLSVGQPGIPINGNVSTNDSNVPSGTTYGTPIPASNNPSSCVPVMASNGSYTFTCTTPGDYNFEVPVCPAGVSVDCPTVPLKVTVSDPKTPNANGPIVNPDIASILADNPVIVKTLANDVGGNPSEPLSPSSVSVVEQPKHGTASVDPLTGNITYIPTPGFVGSDTLTYKVCDTGVPASCGTAQQIFTVLPTNSPNTTVASDDFIVAIVNTPVNGNVSINDGDPEGNTQTVVAGTIPTAGGNLALSSNGTYTFTPANGFTGSVDIPYTTCDNGTPQACAKATLHINVVPACIKPLLTVQNITCTGSSYTVTFSSEGTVTTNNGTISGNTLTVSSGNSTLTATSSCGEVTSMVVTAPSCPVPATCTQIASLSVGNALCTGTGTYTVSFSALNGTVTSSVGTISGNSVSGIPVGTNVVLTLTPTEATCSGQSVTVTSPASCVTPSCTDGSVGISYSTVCNNDGTYNINFTTSISNTIVTSSTNSFVNLTGTVTLTVTKPGCSPNYVDVTPPTCSICQPPTSVVANPNTICSGASSNLSANCSTGTLVWFSDANLSTIVSSQVNPTTTTTYYGICINGACKSSPTSVVVNVNPSVVVNSNNFTKTDPTACDGNTGTIKVCNLVAGRSYSIAFNKNNNAQNPLTYTADANGCVTLSGLSAGVYNNFNITDVLSTCTSGVISGVSIELVEPTKATIHLGVKSDPTACSAYDGTFTVSGLAPNTTYVLNYLKDGFIQTPITFTSVNTSYTVGGLTAGNYSDIKVSNAGCFSNSISAVLSDPAAVALALGVSTNPSSCGANDGSIILTGLVSGTTYTIKYKKNGVLQAPISYTATTSSYTITGLTAGLYSNITVSNGNCVSNSLMENLTDPGANIIALGTVTNPTLCGKNDGSFIISGLTNGLNYTLNYLKDGVQQTPISFTATGSTFTLSGLLAGNYTGINLTHGGCISNTLSAQLMNPGGAIIDVIAFDAQTCMPGNDGTLLITGLSQGLNYTLNYMKNGVAQSSINFNATTTSYLILGLTQAVYSNINVSQGGCISNSVSGTVLPASQSVAPIFSESIVYTDCAICSADLTQIKSRNLPAGTTLEWHSSLPVSPSNLVSSSAVSEGTYYATFYNAASKCYSATTSITVIQKPCANSDVVTIIDGSTKIINVLANDKNPDCTQADLARISTPSIISYPTKGSFVINLDGTISYTPNANTTGTDSFIYQICDKANPMVCDTAMVTINIGCSKPLLTIESISCNVNGTYNVTFSSDGVVSSNAGSITGTSVLNVPSGTNVRLTSTNGCGTTSMVDVNSPNCPTSNCASPMSLSVGQAVCTGTGSYIVSYTIVNGTLNVSSGASVQQTFVNGGVISGTVTVSSLTNVTLTATSTSSSCGSQVITVVAPTNCGTPSCNDGDVGISYSTSCNGNGSYNINYSVVSGTSVTSSTGSFVNLTGSVTLTVTENGCSPKTIIVTPPSCIVNNDVKLQLKVFLQGAFFNPSGATDNLMRDDLRTLGVLPTIEPYSGMANSRFTKVADAGGQSIGAGVLTNSGSDAIVDWVFVELRDASNPTTILKTRAALVQRDGDVVEATDGLTPVTFSGAVGTSYYVSIKHRNHLGAMTASPILMTATGTVVDFTTMTASQLWDSGLVLTDGSLGSYNGSEEVIVGNGKMALWAGNTRNTDNKEKYSGTSPDPATVLSQVITYPANTGGLYNYDYVTPVYMIGDINLDGKVKYAGTFSDTAFTLFNIINKYPNNFTNKLYNFDFMVEQIP